MIRLQPCCSSAPSALSQHHLQLKSRQCDAMNIAALSRSRCPAHHVNRRRPSFAFAHSFYIDFSALNLFVRSTRSAFISGAQTPAT
ncbi:hypothetical protein KCP70_19270 [Salmonella enterica subsp. enterica]|nr:hypothetical protein KCP70_19270 [Salmonella enterica subsp. enterica]